MERRGFIGGLIAGLFGAVATEASEEEKSKSITLPPLEEGEYIVRIDDKGLVSCERMSFDPICANVASLEDFSRNRWTMVDDKLTIYSEGGMPLIETSVLSKK